MRALYRFAYRVRPLVEATGTLAVFACLGWSVWSHTGSHFDVIAALGALSFARGRNT